MRRSRSRPRRPRATSRPMICPQTRRWREQSAGRSIKLIVESCVCVVNPEAAATLSLLYAEAVHDRAYGLLAIGLHSRLTHGFHPDRPFARGRSDGTVF